MSGCKTNTVPLRPETRQLIADADNKVGSQDKSDVPFRELIGSVMFLSTTTRPDISFAVSYLARYMHGFSNVHCVAGKSLLRYLSGTPNIGLNFEGGEDIVGYTDADWARDLTTRKSTSGYVFKIGEGVFSWKSKLQSVVAAPSVEAENIAQAHAVREVLWIRAITIEFGLRGENKPIKIHGDSTGAIALAKDNAISPRLKHIDIVYHLTRDYFEMRFATLLYIPTGGMTADGMTKPLGPYKHKVFMDMPGTRNLSDK